MLTNHLIIIPGLGNNIKGHILATAGFKKFNIVPYIFDTKWRIEENGFEEKFKRALKLVDSLASKNSKISIMGNSAGSSFAINLFANRKNQIDKIIINCGRVRDGDWPWFTFDQATKLSPSFRESVLWAQKFEKNFTNADRKKILTLRPIFDEIVPPLTVPIRGAKNEIIPLIGHSLTITLNMTLLKNKVVNFILK